MERKSFNDQQSSYLDLAKNQVVRYATKELAGAAGDTIKSFIIGQIAAFVFDKFVAPVIRWTWREGIIFVNVKAVERAVEKYKDADAQLDRVDLFDKLP